MNLLKYSSITPSNIDRTSKPDFFLVVIVFVFLCVRRVIDSSPSTISSQLLNLMMFVWIAGVS